MFKILKIYKFGVQQFLISNVCCVVLVQEAGRGGGESCLGNGQGKILVQELADAS